MILPDPKHYWNFNELSGSSAMDVTGDETTVISLNSPLWVEGRVHNALRFNPDDGVKLATVTVPEIKSSWTVAVWVMRQGKSNGATIFSSREYGFKLEQWPDRYVVGFTKYTIDDTIGVDKQFRYEAPMDEWVHLALVMEQDEMGENKRNRMTLYANGENQGFIDWEEPVILNLQWLGSTRGSVEFASAILDELKIFNEALSDDQVKTLAKEGIETTT